ncbi:MAG: hypothetical protein MH252_21380 [Thermosynechococcaceae cyanobacterium MS004]|nr:hypothetical protein [Thermosynechococcaceae cyanobacterium MS004]
MTADLLAQESIDLPEVQEMLRKLSKYNPGVSMLHMHNGETGDFQPLPKELVQVEADLKVSFSPIEEIPEEIQGQDSPLRSCSMVLARY